MSGIKDQPSEEIIARAIHTLWLEEKPRKEAQEIRAHLSNAADDPRYPMWLLDYVPDYVWDLVDIAAERALSPLEAKNDPS